MNIETLREFLVLSSELSFGATAAMCHLSPSALTRHIQSLEEELGYQLFVRTKNAATLTEHGMTFLPEAEKVVAHYDAGLEALRAAQNRRSGRLRVTYLPTVNSVLLDDAYTRQLALHPDVDFALFSGWERRLLHLLDKDSADIALMTLYEPLEKRWWNSETLYHETYVLVVPESHPLYKYDEVSLMQLADNEPLLIPDRHDSPQEATFLERLLREKSVGVMAKNIVGDVHDVSALPQGGRGIVLVCKSLADQANLRHCRAIPVTDPELTLDVCAIWKKSASNPNIDGFLDILKELTQPPPRAGK